MGKSQEWLLLALTSGPFEAGKRFCCELFKQRMRGCMGEDAGIKTMLESQAEGKGATKEEVLPQGCFSIPDCIAHKFILSPSGSTIVSHVYPT